MRGLLVVNPRATSTSARVTDVIVTALSSQVDLQITMTTHRGHGIELGANAALQNLDVVITLSGDGIINEVVNGMLSNRAGHAPRLATIPGGSGNVFARSLGLPVDSVEATGAIIEALRADRTRCIGVGQANDRYFVANAGIGLDAQIIAAMEGQRARGKSATPARYVRTTLSQYLLHADRRHPQLDLRAGDIWLPQIFSAVVQNTSPWTYLGSWPIDPCPQASFDLGLDVFALRKLRLQTGIRAGRRMLAHSTSGSTKDSILVLHDQPTFVISARQPMPLQVDGDLDGLTSSVTFTSIPQALTVYDGSTNFANHDN